MLSSSSSRFVARARGLTAVLLAAVLLAVVTARGRNGRRVRYREDEARDRLFLPSWKRRDAVPPYLGSALRDEKEAEKEFLGPKLKIKTSVPSNYSAPPVREGHGKVRLGITTKVKDPLDFFTWLEYHKRVGVERFYIQVDRTPGLVEKLRRSAYADMIDVTESTGNPATYKGIFDRRNEEEQNRHNNRSIKKAKRDGITHLAHIDSDELLYFPVGKDAFFAEMSQTLGDTSISSLEMRSLEGVYEFSNCVSFFNTTRAFCASGYNHTSYWGYKPIGNMASQKVYAWGPHFFKGDGDILFLPPHVALVLHYETPCIRKWRKKYYEMDATRVEVILQKCDGGHGGWRFPCESVRAFNDKPLSYNADVWRKWKLRSNRDPNALVEIDVTQAF